MSLRGTGAGEDQLWPQVLPGGPLARWDKPQLGSKAEIECDQKSIARTGGDSRNMRKNRLRRIFAASRQRSKRADHGRADVNGKNQLHCRAHTQIQTHMPSEPYDRKSFGLYQ